MKNTIDKILKDELNRYAAVDEITRLHGDASYRTYYRARLSDGSSIIIMQMPEGKSSASEEITNFEGTPGELPFINITNYLAGRGISVPCIYRYSDSDKLMLLEDLGDDLLANIVMPLTGQKLMDWYRKAILLLVDIQRKTASDPTGKCIAFKRSFDATLLNWEFDHFLEYGLRARGVRISDGDVDIFTRETRSITREIESLQYGFTLRDFQSRNIIVRGGKMHIIDFQDALLGPLVYDLVALARDSYIELDDGIAAELVDLYARESGRRTPDVRMEFDLVTVQRKLKDAGRFVYIDRVKRNPGFLKYIPTTLGYVESALKRLHRHGELHGVLKKYIAEWK